MPRGRSKRYSESLSSPPQPTPPAECAVVVSNVAERSNRLLALDNLERTQAQLVQAVYEAQYVGPRCERHWLTAVKHIAVAEERLAMVKESIRLPLEPYGPELLAEREKILTRRH